MCTVNSLEVLSIFIRSVVDLRFIMIGVQDSHDVQEVGKCSYSNEVSHKTRGGLDGWTFFT